MGKVSISRRKLSIFLRPSSSTEAQMDQIRLKMNQSSTIVPRFSVSEVFTWRKGENYVVFIITNNIISVTSLRSVTSNANNDHHFRCGGKWLSIGGITVCSGDYRVHSCVTRHHTPLLAVARESQRRQREVTPLSSVMGIGSLQLLFLKLSVRSIYFSNRCFKWSTSACGEMEMEERGSQKIRNSNGRHVPLINVL